MYRRNNYRDLSEHPESSDRMSLPESRQYDEIPAREAPERDYYMDMEAKTKRDMEVRANAIEEMRKLRELEAETFRKKEEASMKQLEDEKRTLAYLRKREAQREDEDARIRREERRRKEDLMRTDEQGRKEEARMRRESLKERNIRDDDLERALQLSRIEEEQRLMKEQKQTRREQERTPVEILAQEKRDARQKILERNIAAAKERAAAKARMEAEKNSAINTVFEVATLRPLFKRE